MAKRDYDNPRTAASTGRPTLTLGRDPSNPRNWELDDLKKAADALRDHIDAFRATFGEAELAKAIPLLTDEHVKAEMRLYADLSALLEQAKDTALEAYVSFTPDNEDDDAVPKWAYIDAEGKTQYVDTKFEAQSKCAFERIAEVRKCYCVQQGGEGEWKEIAFPPTP